MTKKFSFAFLLILEVVWLLFITSPLYAQEQNSAFQKGVETSYKGDYDLAIASFTEAIRLDPKYLPAYVNRGSIYKIKGDYVGAINDYDEAILLDPNHVPAYIDRGIAYAAMGSGDKALADYNHAIQLDPKSRLAYLNRGLLNENGGDYNKAFSDFETAIHLDPGDGLAYNDLAWLLATCPQDALRDGKKAVEFATKACDLIKWQNPDWLDTLAAACAEAGDFAAAIKWETKYLQTPGLGKNKADDAAARLALYQKHEPYRMQR